MAEAPAFACPGLDEAVQVFLPGGKRQGERPNHDEQRGEHVLRSNYLFTSESVSEGHPDKVCDRVSDEVVDLFFREAEKEGFDPWQVRVACETLATTNRMVIAGEYRGPGTVTRDLIAHARRMTSALA